MNRTYRSAFCLSLVAILAAAACGDDSDTSESNTSTNSSSSSSGGSGGATNSSSSSGMGGMGMGGMGMGGMGMGGTGGMGMGGDPGYCMGAPLTPLMGGASVYYRGDYVTNGTENVSRLVYPGATITDLALMGLVGDYDSIAVSPDGAQIAVSGDTAAGVAELNLYAADGSGAPTTLFTAAASNVEITSIAWSPDGQWLAYRADITTNGANELYVVPAAGGMPILLTEALDDSGKDVGAIAWAPDIFGAAKYLTFTGDVDTPGVDSLWTVDVAIAVPVAVKAIAGVMDGQEVSGGAAFDCLGKMYFKGTFNDGKFRLYRADIDGSNREIVPGSELLNDAADTIAQVGSIGFSPDGSQLAFSSDAPAVNVYQVYVMDLSSTTANVVSNIVSAASADVVGPSFFAPLRWSPDASMIAFTGDWPVLVGDTNNLFGAFVVPSSGAPGGIRLLTPPQGTAADVNDMRWARDGSRLFIRGDAVTNNVGELYSTGDYTAADQTGITEVTPPMGGDVFDMRIGG